MLLAELKTSLRAPLVTYVFLEVFSTLLFEPLLTHRRRKCRNIALPSAPFVP